MNCGKSMLDRDIKNIKEGYRKYCCTKCAKESDLRKELYANTCLERYGVRNVSSNDAIKKKRADTNMRKFGVDNPAKADAVKEKTFNTNIIRYGCGCAMHSEQVHAKTLNTLLTRYGVTSYSKTPEFIEKVTAENMKNFGVRYPNQDPAFRRMSQKRYEYGGMKFDSAPELAFFIYARDNGIDVEYQPDVSFQYKDQAGGVFSYQPDFRVGNKFVEIKGLQFFENKDPSGKMVNPYDSSQNDRYEAKHQCMLSNDVEIITNYSKYIKYVETIYGKQYLKGFKRA